MATRKIIGPISAYAIAKSKGYTGTEEEFATEIANASTNAQTAQSAAETAQGVLESIPQDYSDLSDDVGALKSALYDITPWGEKTVTVETFTNYYRGNSDLIAENANALSAVIPMVDGAKYTIHATGTFNRFNINYADAIRIGEPVTSVYFKSNWPFSDETYEFTNTDGHAYLLVVVGWDMPSFACNLTYTELRGTVGDVFKVNGVPVITKSQFDVEKEDIMDTIGDEISDITNGRYKKDVTPTITNYTLNAGAISSQYVGKLAYCKMKNGAKYKITVSGVFNRFYICTSESIEVGSQYTVIYNENISQGDHSMSYDYVNDSEDTLYLIIFYNYDAIGISDATVTIKEEVGSSDSFTINGIQVYTADETDELIADSGISAYLHYVSNASVQTAGDADDVYDLYDSLVTAYPDYVTRSELGTDEDSNIIYEYQFGKGSYNSEGQRLKDTETPKPVILLTTGVHGDEKSAVMATYQFCADLCSGNSYLTTLRSNYIIKAVPLVCPWGYTNNSRVNSNGVNINRNFDANWQSTGAGTNNYSGASAADQAETQVIQDWLNDNTDAVLYIDFHNSGYTNEVSYLAGTNTVVGMDAVKKRFLKYGYDLIPYFIGKEGFADDLIYAYTGWFAIPAMTYTYANKVGLFGACLETSWNQNGAGINSVVSNRAGAIVLGNLLNSFISE